jgi:hypothetical protein
MTYPDELKELFEDKSFFPLIRKYNTLPSFASMGCNKTKFETHGPYCFKIHGNVYTQINQSATTAEGKLPRNGQIYFVDSDELKSAYKLADDAKKAEIEQTTKELAELKIDPSKNDEIRTKQALLMKLKEDRADIYWGCEPSTLFKIVDYIREHNPYAKIYFTMNEILDNQRRNYPDKNESVVMRFIDPNVSKKDPNRYNAPVATNEVAGIFIMDANESIPENEVVIREKTNRGLTLKSLPRFSKDMEPLTYPLLYPDGRTGWHYYYRDLNGKKITMAQYIRFIQSIREAFNVIYRSRKLF